MEPVTNLAKRRNARSICMPLGMASFGRQSPLAGLGYVAGSHAHVIHRVEGKVTTEWDPPSKRAPCPFCSVEGHPKMANLKEVHERRVGVLAEVFVETTEHSHTLVTSWEIRHTLYPGPTHGGILENYSAG